MDFNPQGDEWIIDLHKVAKYKTFSRITRTLALDLIDNPYLTVGKFFKGLSDNEVKELVSLCEKEDDASVSELLLLSEMLSRAEGITSADPDEMGVKVGALRMMTVGVSLERKGLVRAFYENMTFDTSNYGDKIVFIAKPGYDPDQE